MPSKNIGLENHKDNRPRPVNTKVKARMLLENHKNRIGKNPTLTQYHGSSWKNLNGILGALFNIDEGRTYHRSSTQPNSQLLHVVKQGFFFCSTMQSISIYINSINMHQFHLTNVPCLCQAFRPSASTCRRIYKNRQDLYVKVVLLRNLMHV